jgi:dolichol-phosphate mannosyltransferase
MAVTGIAQSRGYGRAVALVPPLLDILAFCALIGAGQSLRSSHLIAFAVGTAATGLIKSRSLKIAATPIRGVVVLHCLIVALLAVFLRGGVLALLTQTWHWPAQIAIIFAVALGLAITAPGYSYALSRLSAPPRPQMLAVGLIVYACALRLIYAGCVELLPEETYYWNYSQHLDIGYLDHPPMVAWLIRLGTLAFGQTEFGVRAGALACGLVTSMFIYKLARNVFGEASALAALLLTQALPFFFLSGLLMTPDAPLTAAWAASLYFLERALIAGRSNAWWRAGICLGIGLISKYTIALLGPVTLVFMLWDSGSRRWFRRQEPYIAALLALAVFSPVIIWNAQHDWVSFAFQTSRRLSEAPQFALHKLIGSLLVLMTPTGVLAIGAMMSTNVVRSRRLLYLGICIPLSVFVVFSLRHEVKLDWTGASWTAALPLMGCSMLAAGGKDGRLSGWIRAAWPPTIVAMLLIYAAGLHYLVLGFPGLGYGKHIEVVPVGWRDLAAHITDTAASFKRETGRDALIVGMDRYAIASEVAFYGAQHLKSPAQTSNSSLFEGMSLMYGLWVPPESQDHQDLLLVALDPRDLGGPYVAAHAQRLGPIEDDLLIRDGVLVRHYYHRFAYNYQSIAKP